MLFVLRIRSKFLNSLVEKFQLIRKSIKSKKVLRQDLAIKEGNGRKKIGIVGSATLLEIFQESGCHVLILACDRDDCAGIIV